MQKANQEFRTVSVLGRPFSETLVWPKQWVSNAGLTTPAGFRIAALIPAFNEAKKIAEVVRASRQYVNEVVVVDDGSWDGTCQLAERAGAHVICLGKNGGKANAINVGLRYLRMKQFDAAVMLDGDGQHNPHEMPAVFAPILNATADIVIGSRFRSIHSKIPCLRIVGQHGLSFITYALSSTWCTDSQSGFRAFSKQALRNMRFSERGFAIESETQFFACERKLKMKEVGISVLYDEPDKRSPFAQGKEVLRGIVRLAWRERPLRMFMLKGILAIAIAFLIEVIAASGLLAGLTGSVFARGLEQFCWLLKILGVSFIAGGFFLHQIRCQLLGLRNYIDSRLEEQNDKYDDPPNE